MDDSAFIVKGLFMKILHVLDYSLRSRQTGYTIRSKYIFDTQKGIGLEPIVATRFKDTHLIDSKFLVKEEYLDGVLYLNDMTQASLDQHFQSLGLRQTQNFAALHREGLQRQFQNHISRVVEVHRPEVIHVASPAQNALISAKVGQKYSLPVIYEVRGLWHETGVVAGMLDTSSKAYQHRHFLFVEAMKRADLVVTLAETMKEEFIREGIPEDKIFIVSNGVDTSKFIPKSYPTQLAERLGLGSDSVIIGHIGSIRKLEGLRWLFKAGKMLLSRHPHIKILIVGDGDELEPLKRLAKELSLDSFVHFTGRVPHEDILDYYALIDIFAIPRVRSRVTELVTPIKPYEAMAIGKAVIVSDVAALREIIDDGTTGSICNADDPEDLAEKCSALIQDTQLRTKIGHRARQWIAENRDWKQIVANYEPIYKHAIQEKRRRVSKPLSKSRRKRIIMYSQHLVGMGHHFRNLQIARALARNHDVHFVNGGRPIPDFKMPGSINLIQLMPISLTSEGLASEDRDQGIRETFEKRLIELTEAVTNIQPDVIMIEHFPFGRWNLRSELQHLLEMVKAKIPDVNIICSLRDIPLRARTADIFKSHSSINVEKPDLLTPQDQDLYKSKRYYEEVCPTLNACFDALLVHGDPCVTRLKEYFPWVEDIIIPIVYTGYVSEKPNDRIGGKFGESIDNIDNFVLVSAGGGIDGYELVVPCIEAWKLLHKQGKIDGWNMVIFPGPFINDDQYGNLEQMCAIGPFYIERHTPDFLQWMQAANFVISRAGYNTCVNILETGTPALLVPSPLSVNEDQSIRASKLADLGLLKKIDPVDLTPDRAADCIMQSLSLQSPLTHKIRLDGAEKTLSFIDNF